MRLRNFIPTAAAVALVLLLSFADSSSLPLPLSFSTSSSPFSPSPVPISAHLQQLQRHAHFADDVLSKYSLEQVQKRCKTLRKAMRKEKWSYATGRFMTKCADDDLITKTFRSPSFTKKVRETVGFEGYLPAYDIPVEVRLYPPGSSMAWHRDEKLLKDENQLELVFTVLNSSDSRTEFKNPDSSITSKRTAPNSLIAVFANGVLHRVVPGTTGERIIVKAVYKLSR